MASINVENIDKDDNYQNADKLGEASDQNHLTQNMDHGNEPGNDDKSVSKKSKASKGSKKELQLKPLRGAIYYNMSFLI